RLVCRHLTTASSFPSSQIRQKIRWGCSPLRPRNLPLTSESLPLKAGTLGRSDQSAPVLALVGGALSWRSRCLFVSLPLLSRRHAWSCGSPPRHACGWCQRFAACVFPDGVFRHGGYRRGTFDVRPCGLPPCIHARGSSQPGIFLAGAFPRCIFPH